MEVLTRPALQGHDQELDSAVHKMVLGDFVQSFRFSQGSAVTQRNLFTGIAAVYAQDFGPIVRQKIVDDMDSLLPRVVQIKPPGQHVRKTETTIHGELRLQWGALSRQISAITDEYREQPELSPRLLTDIVTGVTGKDIGYQNTGRPNRSNSNSDPYASFTRDYILQSRPTGSPTFDTIFEAAGTIEPVGPLARQLGRLASRWEDNHPGQSFLPKA